MTAFLERSPGRWDVVLSADTLNYFGELGPVMAAAHGALRPGGLLVFTVEVLPDEAALPWELMHHGRYAHSRRYVEHVLSGPGLTILGIEREVMRLEAGEPVSGWLVAARKPDPGAAALRR